jgi:uncharacterized integral membrane protein
MIGTAVKVLSWLVGLPLAVIVLLFALSNRQVVAVGLWPLADGIDLPVYLIVLLPLLIGFLAGTLVAGLKGLKHRRIARRQTKRAADLERQLDQARASSSAAAGQALSSPMSDDRPVAP